MSRILILTGSPRRNGNTDSLVVSFAKGAQENNTVQVLSVYDYKIHPCTGCNACFMAEENQCVQQDDMTRIYQKLKETDVLVLASPVYFYGISAQLKAVVDRLHTPMRSSFPIKKLGLILVGGASLPSLFDAILVQYQLVQEFFHLEDVGKVLIRGAREKGDVSEGDLKKAYLLGRSIR